MDVRDALQTALEAHGEGQRVLLARLSSALSSDAHLVQALFPTIAAVVSGGREPQPVQWAAAVVEQALRPLDARPALAPQSIGAIGRLLASSDHHLEKVGLECFANVYPFLFKQACAGSEQHLWANVIALKGSALRLWRSGGTGAKTAAIKVIQRIIQTQTIVSADPRVQQRNPEPNLSYVRPNHPFLHLRALEDEAAKLLEECITSLFTCDVPDVVSAIALSLTSLTKARPAFTQLVITALTNWAPAALVQQSNNQVRSVEKAVCVSVMHLKKTLPSSSFEPYRQATDEFLVRQAARMEQAAAEAKQLRDRDANRKRQLITDEITDSVKRRRLEPSAGEDASGGAAFATIAASYNTPTALATLDASTLPLQTVVDIIVATYQGQSEAALHARIADARRTIGIESATKAEYTSQAAIKSEPPVDPLKVDLGHDVDDEVLQLGPPVVEKDENVDEDDAGDAQAPFNFSGLDADESLDLVASSTLSESSKTFLIESAVRRIFAAGSDGAAPAVWVPLVSRLITRGLRPESDDEDSVAGERRELLRQVMFDFVIEDMQSRLDFARLWLNEEWYVDGKTEVKSEQGRPYDRWLRRLLEHILQHSSNKDKAFTQFIVDLPTIPNEEISRFGEMCTNPEQVQLGFAALRDLAVMRPPVRQAALDVLLSLTTHPDKLTRNAAINTVKRWVPDVASLSTKVLAFSVAVLARLETPPPPPPPPKPELAADDMAESDDEEEEPKPRLDALVKDGAIIDGLPPATTEGAVIQHVELFFALSVKHPDLLEHLFEGYARFQPFAQESIHELVTPLIRTLGVTSPKLLQLIEDCPPGSEPLVLRVLTILADKSRLPKPVVAAVRKLASRRESLSPRFLIIIIGDCDKAEMFRYIPRIVTVLNNTPEEKLIVRSAFLSVLAPASLSFSATATSVRQRHELLTPVELMVLLHTSEKEMGLKQTIEAIGICFSMPDGFRPEILAAFMTQVVEEPVIPVLFLRTVIQAVTQYKTLQPFVSTTLLRRLILKKVWMTAPLWEGFIRCAKVTQPHSYGALLELPTEQLLDVVTKQPTLREPLREYAVKKGGNSNRMTGVLEVLGDTAQVEVEAMPSASEAGEGGAVVEAAA